MLRDVLQGGDDGVRSECGLVALRLELKTAPARVSALSPYARHRYAPLSPDPGSDPRRRSMKGLTCTAKCMGDAQCTVGCFARYGNPDLDNMLKCTIEEKVRC